MTDTALRIEFIGGSINGEVIEVTVAPPSYEVAVGAERMEIYARQNEQPPFIYAQVGYAENESWKK